MLGRKKARSSHLSGKTAIREITLRMALMEAMDEMSIAAEAGEALTGIIATALPRRKALCAR